jgi:hypothetical protein
MSPTDHEHEWIEGPRYPDLQCTVCGASHSAIQTMLGEAADDARRIAGEKHYTGCRVRQESETLGLWLSNAPPQVLQELEALRPGVYLIHNDAPHALSELLRVQESLDYRALTSQGIKAYQFGPRNDGYIWVCVNTDIAAAQAWFEAEYGSGWFRCYAPEPNTVAMVQLKCPATGEPIDIFEYRSPGAMTADIFSTSIPCPHCGESHAWTSWYRGEAVMALQRSPHATRVLVEATEDGYSATAFP